MASSEPRSAARPSLRVLRRLKALGTRHPAWREDFAVREGPINMVMGWRVTAVDASGAEFGFGVSAGWPEQAQQMAVDLAVILNTIHEAKP